MRLSNREREVIARLLRREHWRKVGWLSGEVYCGAHGRMAAWPCRYRGPS